MLTPKVIGRIPLWALVLLASLGCSSPEPESLQQGALSKVYSLAALGSFGDEVLRTEGRPAILWKRMENESVPTIQTTGPLDLHFAVKELSGVEVRASYDLARKSPNQSEPWDAVFRVTAKPAQGKQQVLFEDRIASDNAHPARRLDLAMPPTVEGAGEIGFEIVFEGSGTATSAMWIDPEISIPAPAPVARPETSWNLLLITADTTRQDFLGAYGGPAATPALESLADDGVLLRSVHSVGYGTTPSHASLLTGSSPREHGVYNNETVLAERFETLPEELVSAGYDTAAFVSSRPVVRRLGLGQGFLHYDDIFGLDPESGLGWYARHERRAERTTDRFLKWLGGASDPFAAWVHFFDPHQPYAPPTGPPAGEREEITNLFTDDKGAPRYVRATDPDDLPLEEVDRAAQDRYRLEIESLDLQIARILQRLKQQGVYDRTLIVFLSDHGENFLNRGRDLAFKHGGLFGEVTKLGAILKLPKSSYAGTVQDLLVTNSDFACLMLDVLNRSVPDSWTCRSFRRHLDPSRGERAFRPHLILEGASRQEIAVRTHDWLYRQARIEAQPATLEKIGFEKGSKVLLFDLRADPEEQSDVAPAEENHAVLARFQAIARDFLAKSASETQRMLQSEEHLEGLKALGYLD